MKPPEFQDPLCCFCLSSQGDEALQFNSSLIFLPTLLPLSFSLSLTRPVGNLIYEHTWCRRRDDVKLTLANGLPPSRILRGWMDSVLGVAGGIVLIFQERGLPKCVSECNIIQLDG